MLPRSILLVILLPWLTLAWSAPAVPASAASASVLSASAVPATASAVQTDAAAPANSWAWPVASPHHVIRAWQAPQRRYSAGHRGIDIAAEAGTPVFSPEAGVVHFSGRVVDRDVLTIAHAGGYLSSFEPIDTDLIEGEQVWRGQELGVVSSPSHCAESCLHFGVRLDGEYVSPMTVLPRAPRAILLPLGGHRDAARARLPRRRIRRAGGPGGTSLAASPS